jgi:hypothetical protein
MDDLLKVFLGETAECLAACWIAVDKLRKSPGDSASLVELLRQVRTIQETSRFLGMSSLQAAAGLTLESLESASARRPASIDRLVPIAVDGLQRIEAIIRTMARADAGTVADPVRTESPPPLAAKAAATEAVPAAAQRHVRDDATRPTGVIAGAAGAEVAGSAPTAAIEGAVHIGADALDYLLSTVRGLVDAQAEMLQLLNAKEGRTAFPGAPAGAQRSESVAVSASTNAEAESSPVCSPRNLGVAPPGMVRVLLFHDAGGVPKAVHLDCVNRLEEVDLKAVDHDRGLWVMRSGNDLLPLVPFDPTSRLPPAGRAPVIVFTIDRDSFGLLVGSVPEVADALPADPANAAQRSEVVLLNGQPIEVIDPARHLDRAIRARFERRRGGRRRLPITDRQPMTPPGPDDLFVRKPSR